MVSLDASEGMDNVYLVNPLMRIFTDAYATQAKKPMSVPKQSQAVASKQSTQGMIRETVNGKLHR